ncbi:MAG TPA: hypothetical protein VG269_22745 [Tepidisphaeraceae bacterium]|jgi:hypothetical protein|nr:hypothetical protein [Tepidisphaeraceae bacterium]
MAAGKTTKSHRPSAAATRLVLQGSHADLVKVAELLEDGLIEGKVSAVMVVGGKRVEVRHFKGRRATVANRHSKRGASAATVRGKSPMPAIPTTPAVPDDVVAARRKYAAETRDARKRIVEDMTSERLAEYRKRNPVAAEYWDRDERSTVG